MSEMGEGGCDVCIDGGDGENAPEFYSEKEVRARKEHLCCECRQVIPKGARYHRFSGKWEGMMDSYTTCLSCQEIRAALCCNGWVFGQLWESARETLFPGMTTGCLGKLKTANAKAMLVERWRQWKGLAA